MPHIARPHLLLDHIKKVLGIRYDSGLSLELGCHSSQVCFIRNRFRYTSDDILLVMHELTNIPIRDLKQLRDQSGEPDENNTYHAKSKRRKKKPVEGPTRGELLNWIKAAADPNCRNCDGTGIYYGNVTLCACVNHNIHMTEAA